MTLKFSPGNHQYRLDGKAVPSVTGLIKGGLPSPALMYWSARTVAEFVADNRDQVESLWQMGRGSVVAALKETPWTKSGLAAAKGTEVHTYAEQLAAGVAVDVPEHLIGYVESCARFLDEWDPTPILTECSVGNRTHWWAGRLDMVAGFDDRGVGIIDWKTGKGIYPEVALQLSAYSHAEFYVLDEDPTTEFPMPDIDWAAAVHLREDGYDVVPVDASDATYKVFRHVALVAKHAKTAKSLLGEPLSAPILIGESK